jgi:hypothetical protein
MDHNDWLEELRREEKAHGDWRESAKNVSKVYTGQDKSAYNILWANVSILEAALYSNTPKPDVQRRYKDKNLVAREVASVLERALEFSVDSYDFDGALQPAINNYLVPGLGQVRVNYVPYLSPVESRIPVDTLVDPETGQKSYLRDGEPVEAEEGPEGAFMVERSEEIAYQAIDCSTVPWDRFHWSPAKDWETVWWLGETHYLTEEQMRSTFVLKSGESVPMGYRSQGDEKKEGEEGDLCRVTEIWDKRTRSHFGVVDGMPRVLKFKAGDDEADDDPLKLSGFWPYPKPLGANVVAGKWVPIPDYSYYEGQADEMNQLSRRIRGLTDQLKYRGVYDGSFAQLANLTNADDGDFQAIENFGQRFGSGGGFAAIMASLPLDEIRNVVAWLIQAREEVKATIFEITGISDIVRGATKATETLGAQQLKSQFGSMRMSRRQKAVEHFVRDIFRIKAEIIAEHFEPEVLTMMTGIQVTPEMVEIMRSDVLRAFNVDVESDSTVLNDQQIEQQNRAEVVQTVTTLVQAWAPIIAQAPQLAELGRSLITFSLQSFKHSRGIEEAVDAAFDQAMEAANQAQMGVQGVPNSDMAAPAIASVA